MMRDARHPALFGFWCSISIHHYVSKLFNYCCNKPLSEMRDIPVWKTSSWKPLLVISIKKKKKHVTDGHLFVNKFPKHLVLPLTSSTDHLMSEFTKAACEFLIPTSSTMAVYQPQVVKTTLMIPWKWLSRVQYWDPPSGQMVMRQRLQRQWKVCYTLEP